MQISYRDDEEGEESDWTDWFTTEGALPQGERAQLETDGESITISATDGKGVRQSVTYTWYTYMPKTWIGQPCYDENEWKNGFRLTAYDGVKVELGALHQAAALCRRRRGHDFAGGYALCLL